MINLLKAIFLKQVSRLLLIFLTIVLVSTMAASAYSSDNIYASGNMPLLTVSESINNTEYGGVANLNLVIKSGSGRIFIDSFPLSKIDTQITMRFATEMACDLLDIDCSNYDFFYTITANSALVGGPSAGAAATVLTVALLDNQELNKDTVMTGTINSGNLIGPVAGVPAKAFAAQKAGYKKILIPNWDSINNTPDKNLSIEVIYVSTLENALYYFTGKNYSLDIVTSTQDSEYFKAYTNIMREVTVDLCTKYGAIVDDKMILPNLSAYDINITNSSQDNFISALDAIKEESYYSAASFCFGGNVRIYNSLIKNLSNDDLKILYLKLFNNISVFKEEMDKSIESIDTISELETYMIVDERLSDATTILSNIDINNISTNSLAYANERFGTAIVWSRFSELPGKKFIMDEELLKIACSKKISEAEERLNYLELYYPNTDIRQDLNLAYEYNINQDYALCIFTASKTKADSDVILSLIFVPENNIDRLLTEKTSAAKRAISKQEQSDIFPIIGYSYYEYSKSLESREIYSSLLYAEYSLELSNLDMYFKEKDPYKIINPNRLSRDYILGMISGFCLGVVVVLSIMIIMGFYYKRRKNAGLKSNTIISKKLLKERKKKVK